MSEPLLNRLAALSDEFGKSATLANLDGNGDAAVAFRAARDRLDEVVNGFCAEDKAAFFNPTLGTLPSATVPVHGPN